MKTVLCIWTVVLLAPAVAWAHEGQHERLMGTIVRIHERRLEIATTEGRSAAVEVPPAASLTRGAERLELADLKPGDRVVITVENPGKEPLVASSVVVGATTGTTPPRADTPRKRKRG